MNDKQQNQHNVNGNVIEVPTDTSNEQAMREYGRQLAIDILIQDAIQSHSSNNVVSIKSRKKLTTLFKVAAAACVLGTLSTVIWTNIEPNQTSPKIVSLDSSWNILAGADADYSIISPNLIKLRHGELRLASTKPAHLTVETPNAVATAKGTDFLIGHHFESDKSNNNENNQPNNNMKIPEITRMLVLTGIVTIATENGSLQAAENEAIVAKANEAPEKIIVQANSKFATKLYTQLAKSNPGQNMFFSPYSVSSALLMATEGARGTTAEEMGDVLGFPDALRRVGEEAQSIPWEMSKIHSGISTLNRLFNGKNKTPELDIFKKKIKDLQKQLKETQANYNKPGNDFSKNQLLAMSLAEQINNLRTKMDTLELNVANALWVDESFPIKNSYTEAINGSYTTKGIKTANFKMNPEDERARINQWVEDKTQSRIKDLLPEGSINKMTELVITNAIYFKADWASPFKSENTRQKDFHLENGSKAKVPLMHARGMTGARYAAFNADGSFFNTPIRVSSEQQTATYPHEDGFSLIELPYAGDGVSMVVIAPNKATGLSNLESKLNEKNLSSWVKKLKKRKVNVTLPKFKSETTYSLNSALTAMGMPTAFDGLKANFRGISESDAELYIGQVAHKAFIEVNEVGTEAAAATGISGLRNSRPAWRPFTPDFRADRPFIYLIRDTKTETILFLGRMMNPKG